MEKRSLFQRESRPRTNVEAHVPPMAVMLFTLILAVVIGGAAWLENRVSESLLAAWVILGSLLALYMLFAFKVAAQWEKAVVLRLGRFHKLAGPGPFWIVPILDTIPSWIDQRVMVTPFSAQKTLTKDTVPVDVDAVLFWVVWDAEKAALEVENYRVAVDWAAQTALRDIIGRMMLADILVGRSAMDIELQKVIDERTTPWGRHRAIGGNPRYCHPAGPGKCHEPSGASRTRASGAGHSGRIGKANCGFLCRGGQGL